MQVSSEKPVDLERVRAFLKAKEERRQARIDALFERATGEAGAIIAQIARELRPRRIYQWGSLLDRARFTEISDIDIAVEGLRGPEEFFRAVGIALDGATVHVDVVEMEKLPADVAQYIRRWGKVVHERGEE